MRIAIFSDTFPPDINGVATSTGNLVKTLKEHSEEVLVLTSNPNHKDYSFEDNILRMPGIKLRKLYGYVVSNFWNKKASKKLDEFKPEVIHIQTDGPVGQFGFIYAKKNNVPSVYTYHTMIEDYTYYVTLNCLLDREARSAVRAYVRHKSIVSDEVVVPSKKIAEYMRYIGVDSYINVLPTGIDLDHYNKKNLDQKKISDIRHALKIDDDDFVVLYLGRLAKEKSIESIIKGFKKYLEKDSKKIKLLIAGGGPYLNSLSSLCKKLEIEDKVIFSGRINPEDSPYYYQLGNVYVSGSITETQGLTFMEAMASSLMMLIRYDESLSGLINDGENGFFYSNEEEFASKLAFIRQMDEEKRKRIILNAYKKLEPYSLDKFYESISEVYKRARKKKY